MAKKKSGSNNALFRLVGALFGVLAIVFSFILDGVKYYYEGNGSFGGLSGTTKTTTTVKLFNLMFGSPSFTTTGEITMSIGVTSSTTTIDPSTVSYGGGMSTFALISFIAVALGVVLLVVSFLIKNKFASFAGGALLVLGGIFVFLTLTSGADLTKTVGNSTVNTAFADAFKDYKLAIGAYLYGILSIVGGALGILSSAK